MVVRDQGSNSRVNEDAEFLFAQDPLQIDLKYDDEKVCEKKEEEEETNEIVDRGRIEPTKKNKSMVPKNHPSRNEIREFEEIMLKMRQSKVQEMSCVCYIPQMNLGALRNP